MPAISMLKTLFKQRQISNTEGNKFKCDSYPLHYIECTAGLCQSKAICIQDIPDPYKPEEYKIVSAATCSSLGIYQLPLKEKSKRGNTTKLTKEL